MPLPMRRTGHFYDKPVEPLQPVQSEPSKYSRTQAIYTGYEVTASDFVKLAKQIPSFNAFINEHRFPDTMVPLICDLWMAQLQGRERRITPPIRQTWRGECDDDDSTPTHVLFVVRTTGSLNAFSADDPEHPSWNTYAVENPGDGERFQKLLKILEILGATDVDPDIFKFAWWEGRKVRWNKSKPNTRTVY